MWPARRRARHLVLGHLGRAAVGDVDALAVEHIEGLEVIEAQVVLGDIDMGPGIPDADGIRAEVLDQVALDGPGRASAGHDAVPQAAVVGVGTGGPKVVGGDDEVLRSWRH